MKRLVSLAWTAILGLSSILFSATATAEVVTQTVAFEAECLDLDTGAVDDSCLDPSSEASNWDVLIAYHADRTVHAVVLQNQLNNVEIAHVQNRAFNEGMLEDIAGATFTQNVIDQPFDGTRVILIRTDLGAIYKLGNAFEEESGVSFDFELLLPVS